MLVSEEEAACSPAPNSPHTSSPVEPSPSDLLKAIKSLNNNLDSKFAHLSSQLQKFQAEMVEVSGRLQLAETFLNDHKSQLDAMKQLYSALQADKKVLKVELDDLESRSRHQNIRIIGIPEGLEKGCPTEYIEKFIPAVEGRDNFPTHIKVDRAHCSLSAKPRAGAPPRPVIARMHHPRLRDLILKLAREKHPVMYDNRRIFFFPDLTQETMQQRKLFDQVRERCRAAGIRYRFLHPARFKTTVGGVSQSFTDPCEADRFLTVNLPAQVQSPKI